MTTFYSKKNNAKTTLASSLSSGALSLTVADGSVFPSSGTFLITIWEKTTYPDPGDDSNMEILKCTSRTGNTLTVERAQEDTSDVNHSSSDAVEMLFTAAQIVELETAINDRVLLSKVKKGIQPNESPNGVLKTFTLPTAYREDSLEVYVYGERVFTFSQTDPDTGEFEFDSGYDAPGANEPIYCDYLEAD